MSNAHDSLEDAFWEILREVEAKVDSRGWDEPPTLWTLRFPDDPSVGGMMKFALEDVIDTDPVEWLIGKKSDDKTVGVVLVTEGWQSPSPTENGEPTPPSAHSQRKEVRIATGMLRTRATHTVMRVRGEAVSEVTQDFDGRVHDALRTYLGSPVGFTPPTPQSAVVEMLVSTVLESYAEAGGDRGLGMPIGQALAAVVSGFDLLPPDALPSLGWGDAPGPDTTWDDCRRTAIRYFRDERDQAMEQWCAWVDDEGLKNLLFPTALNWHSLATQLIPEDDREELFAVMRDAGVDIP